MKIVRAVLLAAATTALTLPAFADNATRGNYSDSQQQSGHHGKHHGARMTREQKLAWKSELRDQMRNMPREQRKAYRQQMKAQWKAMAPAAQQQRLAELDRHWNSMSPDVQQKLLAKADKHSGQQGGDRKHHGDDDNSDSTE